MKRILILNYFTAMGIVTLLTGLIYVSVQQNYRTGANDPQVQIAYDLQSKLEAGRPLDGLFPDSIHLGHSLGTFVTLYDEHAQPLRSSALLDGKMPQLPAGVFEFVKNHNEDRVTWQPRPDVRLAMVVVIGNFSPVGYIAVGRSLQEVEVREKNLVNAAGICWSVMMGFLVITGILHYRLHKRRRALYSRR